MSPQERREAWKAALAHEIDALSGSSSTSALPRCPCTVRGVSANVGTMLFNIDSDRKDATRRLEREYGTRVKRSYRGR